jgi:hypothetical protein
MRRYPFALLLLASCGSNASYEYDLDPILLARAPIEPGGEAIGGLLAEVATATGIEPLLVDSAYPINSLARNGCANGGENGWTYTGDVDLYGWNSESPLRASFHHVGLFDLCSGPTGDLSTQPWGVMGGPLLSNFVVGLTLPRNPSLQSASMALWPGLPGTDDQLAQEGWVSLRFELRGSVPVAKGNGEASLTLPNSRIVLATCAAPRSFSPTGPQETCAQGEVALKANGVELLLAIGTGEGPLILSQSAWERIAAQTNQDSKAGTDGELYTPFAKTATMARFHTLPRLAIFEGTADSQWLGPCAELARARRIEWVLANQDAGACFQPCDANGDKAITTRPYLELGGDLRLAVISETSEILRSLNGDAPPNPQVDGIIGAGTLAGTRLKFDYIAKPEGRVVAACEKTTSRDTCWVAPSCPALSAKDQKHICFGQQERTWAPVCPKN